MVDMSREAVMARLDEAARQSRAWGDRPGPQAVAMTASAIDQRLREASDLTELCLRLHREVTLPPAPTDTVA
jgi:hypothetical protein